jgi:hypothetical protein
MSCRPPRQRQGPPCSPCRAEAAPIQLPAQSLPVPGRGRWPSTSSAGQGRAAEGEQRHAGLPSSAQASNSSPRAPQPPQLPTPSTHPEDALEVGERGDGAAFLYTQRRLAPRHAPEQPGRHCVAARALARAPGLRPEAQHAGLHAGHGRRVGQQVRLQPGRHVARPLPCARRCKGRADRSGGGCWGRGPSQSRCRRPRCRQLGTHRAPACS